MLAAIDVVPSLMMTFAKEIVDMSIGSLNVTAIGVLMETLLAPEGGIVPEIEGGELSFVDPVLKVDTKARVIVFPARSFIPVVAVTK